MSTVTVKDFAAELRRPVEELLTQLREAGVAAASGSSPVTAEDKLALLNYLRTRGGSSASAGPKGEDRKITLKRKETSELRLGGGRGAPGKTVSIEVRKKRVVLPGTPQAGAAHAAEEAAPAVPVPVPPPAVQAEPVATPRPVLPEPANEEERLQQQEAERLRVDAETEQQQAEAARKAAEAEAAARAAEDEARRKREEEERLRADPIYRARAEAEASRRRAAENIRRAAQARLTPPAPPPAPPAAPAPAPAATTTASPTPAATRRPAAGGAPDRNDRGDRNDRSRKELHLAEGRGGKRDKKRRKPTGTVRLENSHQFEKPMAPVVHVVEVPELITVGELANRMAVKATELIKVMMKNGVMATINQSIDQDTAALMVEEMGHKVRTVKASDVEETLVQAVEGERRDDVELVARPPVVTIMGHVDHGKTSLLDYIRKTRVTAGEAGGITQHIGAYHVETPKGIITFLDTPGHAAFTRMRARGAQVTDIVVLVIAADDSVMPQTREAIAHARAARAPLIVAITKVDKPSANLAKVKSDLLSEEVVAEDFGGEVQTVGVSSVSGEGIDALLDAILIQAEVMELTAPIDVPARGQVIESSLEKGRGPVATILVREGTLHQGDVILTGSTFGRVRAMFNESGKTVKSAGPCIPVEVLGLNGVPDTGDEVVVVADERKARELADLREQRQREAKLAQSQALRMDQIFAQMGAQAQDAKHLNLMIKSDVHGSAEALADALRKLPSAEVRVNVLSSGIGGISEGDVDLAVASKAIIIGFNVRADAQARRRIQDTGVDVRYYSIIYDVIDDVSDAISGLLGTEMREQIVGIAEVRDVFRSSKFGAVAGCLVVEGSVQKSLPIRVLRDNTVVYEGVLESLRRFKDDVLKVEAGTECGIAVKNYNDVQPRDQIECYQRIEVRRTVNAQA